MQCLEVIGAVGPIYGSLGVKRLKWFHQPGNYPDRQYLTSGLQ